MSADETFHPLPWQLAAWRRLQEARSRGQFAHAWIVSGPSGVGKKHFVGALVASFLCVNPDGRGCACGVCERCRMLAAGGHPDAHLLSRDGHLGLALQPGLQREEGINHWEPKGESKRKEIGIAAVRSLIDDKLPLAAHGGGAKIAVIVPAETLSFSSADALLKTVEEPLPNTYLILIAEQAISLSATLRSRCQHLRFGMPPWGEALAWLAETLPESKAAQRESALSAARGAALSAVVQLQSGAVPDAERWCAELNEFTRGRGDPLKLAASIEEERTVYFLHTAQIWLAGQLRGSLSDGAGGALRKRAEMLVNELVESHRRLNANVRGQLMLEALLIAWRRWLAPTGPASSESGMTNETFRS